ncbi:hypothetical protein [Dokdonella fugitiva]|jgi:hypothetical protein|uniref:Outer membrane repeat protein n=1 Tax=Dokdonella fugitiva TaxID=328517 RepID=A0A4R2IFF2_9GAMM|nr:hypothetical protein [Dokdonella fugitiva]TCO42922.1 hypothetical protein EV148_101329 [Dokdonella fugitiva]
MKPIRLFVPLFLLIACAASRAATYSVGPVGCTHVSLADALAAAAANPAGPHLIKLRTGELLTGGISLDEPAADITIEGGYASCGASAPTPDARMVIRQINPGSVLRFDNASDTPRRLELRNVTLTGGSVNTSDVLGGGGALVLQNATLVLGAGAIVEGNVAGNGGGVSLFGVPSRVAKLVLDGAAVIDGNQAVGLGGLGAGGGVFALDNAEIRLVYGRIEDNTARRAGGGVALNTARTTLVAAPPILTDYLLPPVVLAHNTAGRATFATGEGFGGAIYSKQGNITIGAPATSRFTTNISTNTANYGGAIYVEGAAGPTDPFTFVALRNTLTQFNTAKGKGGAFHSWNAVDWVLDSTGLRCPFGPRYSACSAVLYNTAYNSTTPGSPGAGAGYIGNDSGSQRGIFRFARTLFENNRDDDGQVAVAMAFGTSELSFERCIFLDNQADASGVTTLLANAPGINLRFVYNTVVGNDVDTLVYMNGGVLRNQGSIMWSPGSDVWTATAGATMANNNCLIAHDMVPGATVLDPRLADDFMPPADSPAIDACDNLDVTAGIDAYLQAPGYDIDGVDNVWGPNDLGAVENHDAIFLDGFGHRYTD